jgi:hypothetical protein
VLPGEDLVANSEPRTTRALTIDASVKAAWEWLAQIGEDRGGFYSYSLLERAADAHIHNANTVHREWQELRVGDTIWLARRRIDSGYSNAEPSNRVTTSASGQRGVDGSGSALIGAHPTRTNIWGNSLSSKISARTASRVSGISNGSVIGRLANPRAVAVSITRLVASPARSRAKSSSSRVPRASTTALSSAAAVSGGWESAVAANIRAGNSAAGPATGVLRAGTPASDPMPPDPGSAVDPYLLRCGHRAHQLTCR